MPRFTILEPISTGDVIDRAVRLYRRNFTPLVAIAAVPSLIGYIASLSFWYGLTAASVESQDRSGQGAVMIIIGVIFYPLWIFMLVATFAGMSRVVGDHVMMGEAIAFRKCFASIRRRLGDLIRLSILLIVLLFGFSIVAGIALGILLQIIGLIAVFLARAGMPEWAMTAMAVVLTIAAVLGFATFLLLILSRVIFIPQIVMIEGEGGTSGLGRASRLGAGNWYRIGAVALFAYFVRLSLFSAMTLPLLASTWLWGELNEAFWSGPTWVILSASFWEMVGLLSMPIWVISLTLLYFDSRVRKEAYDLELLAREFGPEFKATPAFANQAPRLTTLPPPVQTSPLGLAGSFATQPPVSSAPPLLNCKQCGAALEAGARFCSRCGNSTV
jgi:hypothetical protein